MDPNVVAPNDYQNLQAISQHGDLNPVQKTQLQASQSYYTANPNALGGNGAGNGSAPGGGGLWGNAPAAPDLQSIYDKSYTNNPTVQKSMANITALQGKVTAKQQARDTAIANENDNPWYSEATRVGKVSKIESAANNDLTTLTGQLSTEQGNLTNAQAEAQRQVNMATGQYDISRQEYQDTLSQFNMLLNSGAFANMASSDLAQISAKTGISTGVLQSIQQAQSQKAVSPQVVTSTDNAGNQTITVVDKHTGDIIGQDSLSGVGKAKGGGTGKTPSTKEPTVEKQVQSSFVKDASSLAPIKSQGGLTVGQYPQLVAKYAPVMSLQQINQLYMTSPLGQKYGAPKEDPGQIQNLYNAAKGKQTVN